jgi:predicted nucleic acid-binding protein
MKVLVDTSVWSLALRRREGSEPAHVKELESLIADNRVQMIGPIRQEVLSGIRNEAQSKTLETHLSAFPDLPLTADDYVAAARFFNLCKAEGIQRSNAGFLICAVAARHRMKIFTIDQDFGLFAKHLPVVLRK